MLDTLPLNSLEYEQFKTVVDLVKRAWLSGEFLTEKTSIYGQGVKLEPHSVRYTHPIVMLIDELSGSGGDAFPALLGGYGRAVLLGNRTMGAGGHVEALPNLPFSQVQVRMTKSLFYHPDGTAVENNGVMPHVSYQTSLVDFLDGYKAYREFYTQTLLDLIN